MRAADSMGFQQYEKNNASLYIEQRYQVERGSSYLVVKLFPLKMLTERKMRFVKQYLPRFFQSHYEKKIQEQQLRLNNRRGHNQYLYLLELKRHATNIASSLFELKKITDLETIDALNDLISHALDIETDPFALSNSINPLNDTFNRLKVELHETYISDKAFAVVHLLPSTILWALSALGFVLFGVAVASGPLGMSFLALGLALLSAIVCMCEAYNIYVDSRFLCNSQLQEIEEGLNFFSNYVYSLSLFQENPALTQDVMQLNLADLPG
jgi:hypothetical protein